MDTNLDFEVVTEGAVNPDSAVIISIHACTLSGQHQQSTQARLTSSLPTTVPHVVHVIKDLFLDPWMQSRHFSPWRGTSPVTALG